MLIHNLANAPNFDFLDHIDDIDLFDMHWAKELVPPPPPAGQAVPAAPLFPNRAIPPLPAAVPPPLPRIMRFEDILMRRPGDLAIEQDMDWRNLAGLPPPPEYHPVANYNQQGDGQQDREKLAALQEGLFERMRIRRARGREHELEDARAEMGIRQQIRQDEAAVEMGLPNVNVILPAAPEPPARPNLGAAPGKAVAAHEARAVERRRELEERVGKVAADLRSARFREVVRNNARNEEDRQRRIREEIGNMQILQNHARAVDRDEEENGFLNERGERLHQRAANMDAGGLNGERNMPAGDARPRGRLIRRNHADLPPSRILQPAAALRQQQILDHEERRIERSQLMARLRREQENDEAATANRLARLRQADANAVRQHEQAARRQAPVVDLLSSSPETKKKRANVFDLADLADDEEEDDEDFVD